MATLRSQLAALSLAAATLFAPAISRAQTSTTPTPTVAGVASVTGSTVAGSVNGTYVGGSVVTASGIGAGNIASPYGGFAQVTATVSAPRVDSAGIASVTTSTVFGNVSGTGLSGSIVDQSGIGYGNTIQPVGQVTKLSATTQTPAPTDLGLSIVNGSTVKGDVVGTGVNGSLVLDSGVGKGNLANGYGGYTSATVTTLRNAPQASGSVYVTSSTLNSDIAATALNGSVVVSSGVGVANTQKSVGYVGQVTFTSLNPSPPATATGTVPVPAPAPGS